MIHCVPAVLNPNEVAAIRSKLESASFADGAGTAGWSAREVKRNLQVTSGPEYEQIARIVREAFMRSGELQAALLPARATPVLFNRYAQAMEYGPHVDTPVMGNMSNSIRSDIAITIFLCDPQSYDGGELTVFMNGISNQFKLEAGGAIAYPANTLHHVTPVTRGVRDAAIIWVQSQVRDPARREVLWDLENAKHEIFKREGKSSSFDLISKSRANLIRMWAEV
ncbi:Fe2+-dependent dioxygenase [Dyella mobilis]|uniref:Fe2+-dependent dioxygenase n=1 Tax=Dyella mobilis TaxID=1849582 RepID=A0ABS2KCH5_9GAMM|nr:Fe2+-dependent dioxygenase [Dyella mobilis]MBM7128515.1 Fe2+-dependent dioxygenase [Dyella mobilis]GLQ99582.1 PKHD-type hydroxylase YbiX [Dyella mobilis]